MNISLDEQHRAAHCIQRDEVPLGPECVHEDLAMITPCILVERLPTIVEDAMRLDDPFPGGQQGLDDVPWVFDDVYVDPQHPVLVVQCVEQQMVPAPRKGASPHQLHVRSPTWRPWSDAVSLSSRARLA